MESSGSYLGVRGLTVDSDGGPFIFQGPVAELSLAVKAPAFKGAHCGDTTGVRIPCRNLQVGGADIDILGIANSIAQGICVADLPSVVATPALQTTIDFNGTGMSISHRDVLVVCASVDGDRIQA